LPSDACVSAFVVQNCGLPLQGCYTSVQHQYNATYFSATQEDPRLYLMARAVQFFTPGVPMVYYVVSQALEQQTSRLLI
jgi:hypothetical protein